jgi:transcriptional antiterminator NusG
MVVTDASWYVVRNTPRVTGFLGAGTTPIPVSKIEMDDLMKRMEMSEPEFTIDFEIGATVKVNDGPFKGFEGKVSEIDKERGKIKVLVNMFGRDTPVELDSLQIKKVGE